MNQFEEVEDLEVTKNKLKAQIAHLTFQYEKLDFKVMVTKGLAEAFSNILGGLFFVCVTAYICAICLHHLAEKYNLGEVAKNTTWVEFGCLMYIARALFGAFIRVPITKVENG